MGEAEEMKSLLKVVIFAGQIYGGWQLGGAFKKLMTLTRFERMGGTVLPSTKRCAANEVLAYLLGATVLTAAQIAL